MKSGLFSFLAMVFVTRFLFHFQGNDIITTILEEFLNHALIASVKLPDKCGGNQADYKGIRNAS
jgi:hypothetical protein